MKEELARELDKLLDTDIHNITDKRIWMLEMDLLDRVVTSMRETKDATFELKKAQAKDKPVEVGTDRKTKDFKNTATSPECVLQQGTCLNMRVI